MDLLNSLHVNPGPWGRSGVRGSRSGIRGFVDPWRVRGFVDSWVRELVAGFVGSWIGSRAFGFVW